MYFTSKQKITALSFYFSLGKRKLSTDKRGLEIRLVSKRNGQALCKGLSLHQKNCDLTAMNDTGWLPPVTNSSCAAEQPDAQNTTKTFAVARTSPAVKVVFCIVFSVISIGIVLGNIIIVSVFLHKRKLRTRTAYFLVSLALSDIIVGSVGVPSFIYILANSVEFPSFVYILWNTIDVFGATASIWHLMMISIERFYAIGWPFLHRISSKKPYFCLICLVWSVSAVLCSITVKVASNWRYYTLFVSVVSFLWPLSVIIAVYIAMFITASKSVPRNHRQAHGAEREARIAKAILLVIGCFLLAWGPFFGLNFAYWACGTCVDIKYEVILAFKVLQYSSSLANPAIYTARLPGCYRAIVELYGHWLRCRKLNYLEDLEYPLTPYKNVSLIRLRGIDNVSFHRFSWRADSTARKMRPKASGNASSLFRRSKNMTFSSVV